MTTPSTTRNVINTTTAMAVTHLLIPDNVPTEVRGAAIVGVAGAVLATHDSQQLNIRLATSLCGGAGLAWHLLPQDASVRSKAVTTLLGASTLYLAQSLCELSLTPSQAQVPPAQQAAQPRVPVSFTFIPPVLDRLGVAVNQVMTAAMPPQVGPQTVAQTARQQREAVGSR